MEINGKQVEFKNFAKEIRFEDLYPENAKSADLKEMRSIFAKIAGDDETIQANELEAFIKSVEKQAGDDKILSQNEIAKFRNEKLGMYVAPKSNEIGDFLTRLFNANQKRLEEEAPAKLLNKENFTENGKLVKTIEYYDDKTTVETSFKKQGETRITKHDADGKILEDKSFEKNGNITEHLYPGDQNVVEHQITKDDNGHKVREKDIYATGGSHERWYDGDKVVKRKEVWADKSSKVTEYNKDNGREAKVIDYGENGKEIRRTENKFNGDKLVQSVYTWDGNTIITNYDKDERTKSSEFKEGGKVSSKTQYSYKGDKTEAKVFDANGEWLYTTVSDEEGNETELDSDGSLRISKNYGEKIIEKDPLGNVVYTEERDADGNRLIMRVLDDGNVVRRKSDKYYNELEEIIETPNGEIIECTDFEKDENGHKIARTYDGQANFLKEKISMSQDGNYWSEEYEYVDDEKVLTNRSRDRRLSNGREQRFSQNYVNGKLVGITERYYSEQGSAIIVKDGEGQVKREYYHKKEGE